MAWQQAPLSLLCSPPTDAHRAAPLPPHRAISSREFWTTNPSIMQTLAAGNEDCLATTDLGPCVRAEQRFRYGVKITGAPAHN